MKILMVCLGNICRSPIAQGVLTEYAKNAGLDLEVESAGTSAHMPGCAPHEHSQQITAKNGIDISNLCCRQFVADDINYYDKIFVMDKSNYNDVKQIAGKQWNADKVDFLMNIVTPGSNEEVPDPWYGTKQDYSRVYEMIDLACKKLIRNLASAQSKQQHD